MSEEKNMDSVTLLQEIRDGQRELINLMTEQRALAQEQLRIAQERISESVGLQKEALRRVKSITVFAVPAILVCIVAIVYLVLRYF